MKKHLNTVLSAAVVLSGVGVNAALAADSGVVVSGFLDPQGSIQDNMSASSFSLYDSAIYIGKKMGSTQVFFDIPVTSTITAGSIDLNIGKVRGQGWVEHTTSYGLSFKAGQFDTIYGFESNDT